MRFVFFTAGLIFGASCAGADLGADDSGPGPDSGSAADAAVAGRDAGASVDAGGRADAGPRLDAGGDADAGARPDGGISDAGGSINPGSDAGAVADGGAAADAGGTADAGARPDAGSTDAGPQTWCTGRTEFFCDDFDRPSFTASAWVLNDSQGGTSTSAALGTSNVRSAPNALVSKTVAVATGSEFMQFQRNAGSASSADHVDEDIAFSVRVAALGGSPRTEFVRVEGINPINFASYGLSLLVTESGAAIELQEASMVTKHALAAAPVIGEWTRIVIHLGMERIVTGPPTSISVKIGDAAAEAFSIGPGMGTRPYLRLGLKAAAPSAACEAAYDDVTFDAP